MDAVGSVPYQSHALANLVQGALGVGAFLYFCSPLGWISGLAFAVDAGLDLFTGRGLFGWLTFSDTRSFAATIAESLRPPVPARAGFSLRAAPVTPGLS